MELVDRTLAFTRLTAALLFFATLLLEHALLSPRIPLQSFFVLWYQLTASLETSLSLFYCINVTWHCLVYYEEVKDPTLR